MCVILFPVSLRELVFLGWWNVYLWRPLCYFVAILQLFSLSLSIVLWYGCQLLNLTVSFLRARCIRSIGFYRFLSFCHRRHVAGRIMLYKVNSNSNHCRVRELRSASTRVRHTRAAAAAHPLVKYQGVERPNLLDLSCRIMFECGMAFHVEWPECGMTWVWHRNAGWVQGYSQSFIAFLSFFFCGADACGVAKAIY